jgi:hypothetical protein
LDEHLITTTGSVSVGSDRRSLNRGIWAGLVRRRRRLANAARTR